MIQVSKHGKCHPKTTFLFTELVLPDVTPNMAADFCFTAYACNDSSDHWFGSQPSIALIDPNAAALLMTM